MLSITRTGPVMTISVLPKTVRADHFRQSWCLVLVRPDKKELPVLLLGRVWDKIRIGMEQLQQLYAMFHRGWIIRKD